MKNNDTLDVDLFISSSQSRFSNFKELSLSTLFNTARSTITKSTTARSMITSLLNAQFSASAHFDRVTSHLTERNRLKKNDQSLWKIMN